MLTITGKFSLAPLNKEVNGDFLLLCFDLCVVDDNEFSALSGGKRYFLSFEGTTSL